MFCLRWRNVLVADCNIEFGSSSAPYSFSAFAQALCWCVQQRLDKLLGEGVATVFGYLDDIGVVCESGAVAERAYQMVLDVWDELNVEASAEKCKRNVEECDWLGLHLDLARQRLRLPGGWPRSGVGCKA